MRLPALAAILLLGTAAAPAEETPFEPGNKAFADAAGCKSHLVTLLSEAKAFTYAAAEGPYEVVAGDIRIHLVAAEGAGHRITEHRCLAETFSSRSWTHSMAESEEEFTVEKVARSAEWMNAAKPR